MKMDEEDTFLVRLIIKIKELSFLIPFLFSVNVGRKVRSRVHSQLMWSCSQIMWVRGVPYSQLMWSKNGPCSRV